MYFINFMKEKNLSWLFLIALAFIWGSSFILMKKALISLSALQIGALRILISGVFLLIIGHKRIFKIQKRHWFYLILNGFVGSFIPVFLYVFAVQNIDSAIVSILNSLTPLNTLLIGGLFFSLSFQKKQLIGVLIGLLGTLILILNGATLHPNQNYWFSGLVIIATVCYAFNVNILKRYLQDLDALSISVGNFLFLIIPAFIILFYTDFFTEYTLNESGWKALGFVSVLAILGTGVAVIIYSRLAQITTPVFSSSVTYLIPIVAVSWGLLDGEKINFVQMLAGLIIIIGVYLVNRSK